MFGRKKMYKKGLADAMQAYEAFGKKQEAAIAHMREEIRKGQKLEEALNDTIASLGDDITGLYDYLNAQEKKALYHLSTPLDIKNLDKEEQQYLLAILYQLASDEGDLLTDYQRMFIRSVQRYLEITNPQTEADLSAVGDIDSLEVQKAFLQTVLEFFYLQDGDELSDTQEEFLGCFSVNKRQALLIEERVSRLFNVVKAEGIAEKYGFVAEETDAMDDEDTQDSSKHTGDIYTVSPEQEKNIDIFVGAIGPIGQNMIETTNYLLGSESSNWFRLDKSSGEKTIYKMDKLGIYGITNSFFTILEDTVYFEYDHTLIALDVSIMQKTSVAPIPSYIKSLSAYDDKVVFVGGDDKGYIYDVTTQKCREIPGVSGCWSVFAVQSGIYFISDGTLKFYDCKTKEITIVAENISSSSYGKLLYCSQSGVFYILESGAFGSSTGFRRVCSTAGHAIGNQRYSLMEHLGSVIHAYKDCLIFVAPGGRITRVDYESGETTVLADDATSHHHLDGGLFRKSSSWDEPVEFDRVGNYIYYFANGDYSRVCKLSITNPGEKEVFSRDYESFREGIIEKT